MSCADGAAYAERPPQTWRSAGKTRSAPVKQAISPLIAGTTKLPAASYTGEATPASVETGSKTAVLAYAAGTGAFRVPVTDAVAVQLQLDLGVTIVHDSFVYFDHQGAHKAFEPAPASASLAAGLSVSIP